MRLGIGYTFNGTLNLDGISICYSIPVSLVSGLVKTDSYFQVKFFTRETGNKTIETKGEVRLLNYPDPAGVVTLRGSYTGPEWKLHVLDHKIATP